MQLLRSSFFAVKDLLAFLDWIAEYRIALLPAGWGTDELALWANTTIPDTMWDVHREEHEPVDFLAELTTHLADGYAVAIEEVVTTAHGLATTLVILDPTSDPAVQRIETAAPDDLLVAYSTTHPHPRLTRIIR